VHLARQLKNTIQLVKRCPRVSFILTTAASRRSAAAAIALGSRAARVGPPAERGLQSVRR
jgi:hypothetical protein